MGVKSKTLYPDLLIIPNQGLKNFSSQTKDQLQLFSHVCEHATLLASKDFWIIKALVLISVALTTTNPKGCECSDYMYMYI